MMDWTGVLAYLESGRDQAGLMSFSRVELL